MTTHIALLCAINVGDNVNCFKPPSTAAKPSPQSGRDLYIVHPDGIGRSKLTDKLIKRGYPPAARDAIGTRP